MSTVRVLVVRAAGTNCDVETAHAFELAGGAAERIHLNRLLDSPSLLDHFQILALPGGFSYGDDISAGKVVALQFSLRLEDALREFVLKKKLIIGICNGFQSLLKMRLLPGPLAAESRQVATLTSNIDARFHDRWIKVRVRSKKCVWTAGLDQIELPIAHAEGRFMTLDDSIRQQLWDDDRVALTYDETDISGSVDGVAGICDASGQIFGLMPHPERFAMRHQHFAWTADSPTSDPGDGLAIFQNGVRWFG